MYTKSVKWVDQTLLVAGANKINHGLQILNPHQVIHFLRWIGPYNFLKYSINLCSYK